MEKIKAGHYVGKNAAGEHVEIRRAARKYKGSEVWNVWIEGDMKAAMQGLSLSAAKKNAGVSE